jgi:hypothetical protein
MGPMSDDAVSNQLLMHHLCTSLFVLQLAKSLALCCLPQHLEKLGMFGCILLDAMLLNHFMTSIWAQ